MIILASVAATLLLIQIDGTTALARLEALDTPAASRAIAADPAAARAALEILLTRVDASVHSDRRQPEQRRVEFDEASLALGQRLSRHLAEATGDRAYARRFQARKTRLDGTVLLNDRRYREALTPLTAALKEAQALKDLWLQAITRVNLAYGNLELGRGPQALQQSEEAARIARSLDHKARGLTLYNMASVHLHLGNFARSIDYSRQAIEASQAAGIKLWHGNSLLNMGAAHQALGDIDAARKAFEEALAVLETTRDVLGTGRALFNLGVVAAEQGRNEPAADYLERALPIIRSADIRHSHHIELKPEQYQNPIEIAALQVLIDIYSRTGQDARSAEHREALRKTLARPSQPVGHSHKG